MTHSASIVKTLSEDVSKWASTFSELLSNERDMQVKLAIWLEKECGWKVHTEYRVPYPELICREGLACNAAKGDVRFPWDNDISVDIVVEREGEFAALELKYATRPVADSETIFNEPLHHAESKILKDQGAADLVMYNYWKDVRRIEVLSSAFADLKGGLALIITNNRTFRTAPAGAPSYIEYATYEGNLVGGGALRWGNKATAIMVSHPDMELSGQYECRWHDTSMPYKSIGSSPESFHYMLSIINKQYK